jgi:glutathione S-transferase
MSSKQLTVVVMNKRYSSWSMRGWLAVRYVMGEDGFEEILINLAGPGVPAINMLPRVDILKYSPSGKAPALIDNGLEVTIHESLAIVLHVADRFPSAGLLPSDPGARAMCLSACAEMHAGFTNIRTHMTFNCCVKALKHGIEALKLPEVKNDIHRLAVMWSELKMRFGCFEDGKEDVYLFGTFSAADCMYAPVAVRFMTYDPELTSLSQFPLAQEYVRVLYRNEMVQEWIRAAHREGPTTFLKGYEAVGDTYDPTDFDE